MGLGVVVIGAAGSLPRGRMSRWSARTGAPRQRRGGRTYDLDIRQAAATIQAPTTHTRHHLWSHDQHTPSFLPRWSSL